MNHPSVPSPTAADAAVEYDANIIFHGRSLCKLIMIVALEHEPSSLNCFKTRL